MWADIGVPYNLVLRHGSIFRFEEKQIVPGCIWLGEQCFPSSTLDC